MDASREQVIQWCIDNKVDFAKPIFPPPDGWGWYDNEGAEVKTLSAVFTNTEDADIEWYDVLLSRASEMDEKYNPETGEWEPAEPLPYTYGRLRRFWRWLTGK